jgi:uncharacterized protein (TIGR02145 family)
VVVYGSLSDSRDSKTYKTVVVGTQTWMAENLNFNAPGSKCYGVDNAPINCNTYGRLYNLETAKAACPSGWKLPSEKDWETLIAAVGGVSVAGTRLKAESGWNNNGNGTNVVGFSALPGGYEFFESNFSLFYDMGTMGYWWSSGGTNWVMANSFGFVHKMERSSSVLLSVRCLKGD